MPDFSFEDLLNFQRQGPGALARAVSAGSTSPGAVTLSPTPEEARRTAAQAGQNANALKGYAADVAQGEAQDAKAKATYGTSDPSKIRELDMPGSPLSDPKAFALLSSTGDPKATEILDKIDKARGAGPASPEGLRRGTQSTEHGDIPYFTNLPGDAGSTGGPMAGVRDLAPYAPGGSPDPGNTADPLAGITDPDQRAVARKLADARTQVAAGQFGPQAIARETARRLPAYEADVATRGLDAARAGMLDEVSNLKTPLGVLDQLDAHVKQKEADRWDMQYAKLRQQAITYANTHGVKNTLDVLEQERIKGTSEADPKQFALIQGELAKHAASALSVQGSLTPGKYLPATAEDVDQWPDKAARRDFSMLDPFGPRTLANPHGSAPNPVDTATQDHEDASTSLLNSVQAPSAVGTPVKTAYDYTHAGNTPAPLPTPGRTTGGPSGVDTDALAQTLATRKSKEAQRKKKLEATGAVSPTDLGPLELLGLR